MEILQEPTLLLGFKFLLSLVRVDKMVFKFQIHLLDLHLGDDKDSSWGISLITISHLGNEGSLFRLCWSTNGYLVLGFLFFPYIRIKMSVL